MNDILKQRLVGALILVALGVVFWPIIFVQPGDRPGVEQPRIPPRPDVITSPIEPPDQVGLRPAREVEARSEAEEAAEAIDSARAEPALVPEPVDVSGEPTPQPVATPEPGPLSFSSKSSVAS